MTAALLIIDMQKGLFTSDRRRHDQAGTVARLNTLAAKVRSANGTVIFIQHHGPIGSDFHPSCKGWPLLPELDKQRGDLVINKSECDAFLNTILERTCQNRGIDHLIIGGCATDYCVDTTVRRALGLGYRVTVASDGHTTADRPHLSAEKIIQHHNAIWADFIAPNGPAKVIASEQIEP